jgi:hypothetical protein
MPRSSPDLAYQSLEFGDAGFQIVALRLQPFVLSRQRGVGVRGVQFLEGPNRQQRKLGVVDGVVSVLAGDHELR